MLKRFFNFAIVILMLQSVLCSINVSAQSNTVMINPSEYAYIVNGNENSTSLVQSSDEYHGVYENYDVSSDNSTNDPTTPVRTTFWKFDLSKYVDEGYGIEKAEILYLGGVYSWPAPIYMYDCPTNDLITGSNYLNVPKADINYKIEKFDLQNASFITENYENVSQEYNVSVNVTDYVNEKIGKNQKSFTYMLYPQFGQSTYRLFGKPLLYITLGEKNLDAPLITYNFDNTNINNSTQFTANVTLTDSNGIDKVEFYDNGNFMDGNITCNVNEYTYVGRALSPGFHTLTVKAYDKYGKFSVYDKNCFIVTNVAILDPIVKTKIKKGNSIITNVDENGGGIISTINGSKNDIDDPDEALFYRFDIKSITSNNLGITGAYILQNAESRTWATSIAMYDCPDNSLTEGMNYTNVPKALADKMFENFDITNLTNVDLKNFPGVEKNYNLALDATEYVQEKADGSDGFTFMIYPKFDGSSYKMTSAPLLYLTLGNVDADSPTCEFISNNTLYSDKGNFVEKIRANDFSGIGSIKFYMDETELAGGYTVSNDIYTFTGAPLVSGNHTIKAVVKDIYGKKSEITKQITVSMSHAIIYPFSTAYTAWGDQNQTSEKYANNNDSAYWVMATDYTDDGGISSADKNSKYWNEPQKAIYTKFDLTEYVNMGLTITKAYIVQNSQTGGETYGRLLDCPENDLENGDNYTMVPSFDKNEIVNYSVGSKTETYFTKENMQYNFPGARQEDNFALDISKYAINKLEDKNSFTVMEYPYYCNGQIRYGNMPALYVEFSNKVDISLLDTSSLLFEDQKTMFAVKTSNANRVSEVEYYIDNNLVASSNINVDEIYATESENIPDGTYTLKVKAIDVNNSVTTVTYPDYIIQNKNEEISFSNEICPVGLNEFSKNNINYIVISNSTKLENLKLAFEGYIVVAYSSIDGSTKLDNDKILSSDIIIVKSIKNDTCIAKKYIAVMSGYHSPINLKIKTGTELVSAEAQAYALDKEDLKLIIIGYKDGKIENICINQKSNSIGNVSIYAETERGNATEFKAFLWNGMYPVATSVTKNLQTVILKFDDFTIWSYAGFNKLMDYLDTENISAGFGAIAQTFDHDNDENYNLTPWYENLYNETIKTLNRANNSPLYEIWCHGYSHKQDEFSTDNYDSMKDSLEKAINVMNKHGVNMKTFGSPFNTATSTTLKVIEENFPDIKTVLMFNNCINIPNDMINIKNHASPEIQVGTISYDYFMNEYEKYQKSDYVLLQSHPGNWNDDSWVEFKKIIDYLKERGVVFMTPTQYSNYNLAKN